MPAGKTKYNTSKCSAPNCGKMPHEHTIKMENPHGFRI